MSQDYDQLPAGPGLDALVAEKVMEWGVIQNAVSRTWINDAGDWIAERDFRPSTDIAAAWLVLTKFEHWTIERERGITKVEGGCFVVDFTRNLCRPTFAEAAETPLAISRAALKAVNGTKP